MTLSTADVVEFLQADVPRVGGSTEWQWVTQLAAAPNLLVVPHGGDTLQIHQPLVAVMPTAPMLEYLPWILDLFMEPVAIENGHMRVPQTPSASTRVRADSLERWRVA